MYVAGFAICLVFLILGGACTLALIFDDSISRKYLFASALITAISIYGTVQFHDQEKDVARSINNEPKVEFGVIKAIGEKSVTVDNLTVEISQYHKVEVQGIAVGNFVRMEFIEGDFYNFVKTIESAEQME